MADLMAGKHRRHVISRSWLVHSEHAARFPDHWLSFMDWTEETGVRLKKAWLIADMDDAQRFLTEERWNSAGAVKQWLEMPEQRKRFGEIMQMAESHELSVGTLIAWVD
jgi:hypothetical protein